MGCDLGGLLRPLFIFSKRCGRAKTGNVDVWATFPVLLLLIFIMIRQRAYVSQRFLRLSVTKSSSEEKSPPQWWAKLSSRRLLYQPPFRETDRCGAGNDEVIEHLYIDQGKRLLKGLREGFVSVARLGNTRRVVVR
jgi:hypothetical protein